MYHTMPVVLMEGIITPWMRSKVCSLAWLWVVWTQ